MARVVTRSVEIAAEDSRLYTSMRSSRPERARRFSCRLVSRDFELVAVGIAKVNGVRNLVVLEFELDGPLLKLLLCSEKIFPVRTKSEMQHADSVVWSGFRIAAARWKESNSSIAFADERGNAIPHSFVLPLQTQDINIPLNRAFHVAHCESYVINSIEPHEQRECLLCRWHGVAGPYDSVSANWAIETFQGDFSNVLK